MKTSRWLMGIAILYFLLYVSHALILQKTVYGDGIYYFSWLRSVVVDRNINFTSEYSHFGVTAPITSSNLLGNKHPVGTPLFWLPWYAQAHTIIGGSGYTLPYQLLTGFISVLAAVTGLILLYRLLMLSFSPTISILSMLTIAGATNLLFYGAIDTVNSHAISFFAAVVFLSFLSSKNVSPFLTGCALGFCALVRAQDAVLGILIFPNLIKPSFAKTAGLYPERVAKLNNLISMLLGALFAFSPQLLAWYALYGTPWTSPYLSGGESFSLWPPHVISVLFSPTNGLFLWTPVTMLAVAGLLCWKDHRRKWFIAVFVIQVILVGSWSTWWQGASYSGRMFVSTLPVLAFGLAALYTRLVRAGLNGKAIILTIIGPLAIINAILIIRFLLQT